AWLRSLIDILDKAPNAEEFLEHTKLEMFQDQVFCFTPKGKLISLPRGATPIDFAYAVHSQVGDTCVGAKINGRMLPLRTQLANGDQIEIVTSRAQTPSPTWERFVVTITTGKGVTIPTIDCATLESFSDSPDRWIDVGWDTVADGATAYTGRLKITVANQPGSLSSLSTVIARHEGNISNLRIVNRSMDFFDMVIDVEVADVKHLADITAALRATPAINAVERARN